MHVTILFLICICKVFLMKRKNCEIMHIIIMRREVIKISCSMLISFDEIQ